MKKYLAVSMSLVLLLAAAAASATTWVESEVKDPVSGQTIKVQEPASSGSYIYSWPGKEDQVFWPHTDDAWLWFNPRSGYGAFGDDFGEVSGDQRERLSSWLRENYDRKRAPKTRLEKLAWLERIYGQRGMGDDFWCFYYRLMAFEHAESDPATSLEYVRKALPLLEKQLAEAPPGDVRIPVLYLLGEYHRRLGDGGLSRKFFEEARQVVYTDEEGAEHTGSTYFNELIAEREALAAGPAPEPASDPP